MNNVWISFKRGMPKGNKYVLLFHPKTGDPDSDIGIPVSASNPEYARKNAQKHGYTHWCYVPYPLPKEKKEKP